MPNYLYRLFSLFGRIPQWVPHALHPLGVAPFRASLRSVLRTPPFGRPLQAACAALLLTLSACQPDDDSPKAGDLSHLPYTPTAYEIERPRYFPVMPIPADNPMTEEGIALGRFLFYDPILSLDSSISCASCHQQAYAFSDPNALSEGVGAALSLRNSMSLANVGYYSRGLFWDGRAPTLEAQALHPVEDPLEMAESWDRVEAKLRRHPDYPRRFREAFGVEDRSEMDRYLVAKALAQFQRTIISSTSPFDFANYDWGEETVFFSPSELRGRNLFFAEPDDQSESHPGCSHCHTSVLMTTNEYLNNGLTLAPNLSEFPDLGFGLTTGRLIDNGKFRTPTLRNTALTAPYMHDGRFQTLEEVLDHYSSGGHYAPNLDANILPFTLTAQEKADLLAFLHTMTDTAFVRKEALGNPYE
jgi:cytochrome c peroxidase